jgi:transposase-like protein
MDASTIAAAYTGAKVALQTLRTVISTKADIAADTRVIDAFEQLGRFRTLSSNSATQLQRSRRRTSPNCPGCGKSFTVEQSAYAGRALPSRGDW